MLNQSEFPKTPESGQKRSENSALDPSHFCPNCSQRLLDHRCKLELSAMRLLPELLRFLLIIFTRRVGWATPCVQRSSFALIVIFAFRTFETGHPAFAFSAAF